jgi:hypothetical protein
MRRYKLFYNLDKEEQWLNDQASQGNIFTGKSTGSYRFLRGKPEKTNIRIDYRVFKKQADFEDYLALFEDSGWKHIAGTKGSGYQYFKQAGGIDTGDIFSDRDSKAARYKRMSRMWASLAAIYIPVFFLLLATKTVDGGAFLQPKELYLTQGLWEKAGTEFWRAFWFETPFALFRGLLWMSFPLMIILYVFFSMKATRQYRRGSAE